MANLENLIGQQTAIDAVNSPSAGAPWRRIGYPEIAFHPMHNTRVIVEQIRQCSELIPLCMLGMLSQPEKFRLQLLSESSVNLSTHRAPNDLTLNAPAPLQ